MSAVCNLLLLLLLLLLLPLLLLLLLLLVKASWCLSAVRTLLLLLRLLVVVVVKASLCLSCSSLVAGSRCHRGLILVLLPVVVASVHVAVISSITANDSGSRLTTTLVVCGLLLSYGGFLRVDHETLTLAEKQLTAGPQSRSTRRSFRFHLVEWVP